MEKVVTKVNQTQQKSDFHYWQSQSYQKRLEALEQIRREYHQYLYNVEPRLQRIYTIIKR
jgi:DNA repair ATPase RecN